MSWSDDIRCLYCDGKLPAYRKLASGQFCSGAHQKAYWKKQEQLAVERLSQTAESLAVALPENPVVPAVGSPDPGAKRVEQIVRTAPAKRTEHTEHIEPALAVFDLAQGMLAKAASYPMTADRLVMRTIPLEVLVPESLDVVLPSAPQRPDASLQETSFQAKIPDLTQTAHLALPVKFGCPVIADGLVMQRVALDVLVPKSLEVVLPSAPRRTDTSLQEKVPDLMEAGLLGLSIKFGPSVTADPMVMRRVPLEVLAPESLEVLLPGASYRPDALLQDQDQLLQEKLPDLTQAELFALPVTFGAPVALAEGGPATGVIAIYPNSADPALPKSGLVPVDGAMSPAPPVSLSAYANLVPQDPA